LLLPVIVGLSVITFFLSHVIPGDPARYFSGPQATDTQVQEYKRILGLDKPLPVQYLIYLMGIFHGDLGVSIRTRRTVVLDLVDFFPASVELVATSLLMAVIVGVPLGILAATRKDTLPDYATRVFAIFGVSTPSFWLALMLQWLFFGQLGWLPLGGRLSLGVSPPSHVAGLYTIDSLITGNWSTLFDALRHLALPALALSYVSLTLVIRMTRTTMLDALTQDYIKTARAKGLKWSKIVFKHALRNALIPTTTVVGLAFGSLLGGAVLVEIVFQWPGLGTYAANAFIFLDYPAIIGSTLLIALVYVLVNLGTDMLYGFIDPRIKIG